VKPDPSATSSLSRSTRLTARRLATALVGLSLVGTAALASAPAQAGVRPSAAVAAAAKPCVQHASRPTRWRLGADTTPVSERVNSEVASVVRKARRTAAVRSVLRGTSAGSSAGSSTERTVAGKITVPVYLHVIHGTKKSERRIGRYAARRMFRTLKAGYAGAQNPAAGATSFTFKLRKITISRNRAWYHALPLSRVDRQMKNRLHRGKMRVLNIYVNRPRSYGQPMLGYSTFPWQRAARTTFDGVTINDVSLPGGRARGYNQGDTVIHETGHWLGLLHTFQGGCSDGDHVKDTPAEADAEYYCEEGRNTCLATDPVTGQPVDDGQPDPIHNFMDYSYDSCMNGFTPGQNQRMVASYLHYRARR
jgi:hypothetical protein